MPALEAIIDAAWERRGELHPAAIEAELRAAVEAALDQLESGTARVALLFGDGAWQVNQWLKKAVLLYFRLHDNRLMDGGPMPAWDKVPLRFVDADAAAFARVGARVVPGALVRRGAHVAADAVLMP